MINITLSYINYEFWNFYLISSIISLTELIFFSITEDFFASSILLESGLSFLGIGTQPPMPSWGYMIKENYQYILLGNAYLALIPGLFLMILVTSFIYISNYYSEIIK